MTQLKVGQIWEYAGERGAPNRSISDRNEILHLTGPLTAVEIMAIDQCNPGGITYHPCLVVRDDSKIFTTALLDKDGHIIMIPKTFDEAITDGEWVLLMDVTGAGPMGVTCTKCKKDYPYANYVNNFECWACKNGF
jgi:hypothetical protein